MEAERCPALDMSCKVEVSWFFVVFGLRRNLKLEWNWRKGASEKVQKNSLCLTENSLKDLQKLLWQISCWSGPVGCCIICKCTVHMWYIMRVSCGGHWDIALMVDLPDHSQNCPFAHFRAQPSEESYDSFFSFFLSLNLNYWETRVLPSFILRSTEVFYLIFLFFHNN